MRRILKFSSGSEGKSRVTVNNGCCGQRGCWCWCPHLTRASQGRSQPGEGSRRVHPSCWRASCRTGKGGSRRPRSQRKDGRRWWGGAGEGTRSWRCECVGAFLSACPWHPGPSHVPSPGTEAPSPEELPDKCSWVRGGALQMPNRSGWVLGVQMKAPHNPPAYSVAMSVFSPHAHEGRSKHL